MRMELQEEDEKGKKMKKKEKKVNENSQMNDDPALVLHRVAYCIRLYAEKY